MAGIHVEFDDVSHQIRLETQQDGDNQPRNGIHLLIHRCSVSKWTTGR
nr:hypothetical protein [Paenibacillus aceti]